QRDAFDVLHRIVEQPLWSPPKVVNGNGVGVTQLTGQLHFAFEAANCFSVRPFWIEQLDGRGTSQERVMPAINDAHTARADLVVQRILPQSLGLYGFAAHLLPIA